MFAIVEIAGKQFMVSKGDVLEVPKLKDSEAGDTLKLETVLLKSDDSQTELGQPFVSGSMVELRVKEHGKGEKLRIFKKKSKKRYERTQGHRQQYTEVEVLAIK